MRQFIWQQPGWPELLIDLGALARTLTGAAFAQGEVAGAIRSLSQPDRDRAMVDTMVETAIETSQIEGEQLSIASVRASLARRHDRRVPRESGADARADGIVAITADVQQNARAPVTKARLFRWHAELFSEAPRSLTVGEWRTERDDPMRVVSGPVTARVTHFEAPPAALVDTEMERFLDWFESPNDLPALVHAAVAHLRFLTVHPFSDGNGRIGRAIADLRLTRTAGETARFISLSREIRKERREYYDAIERAQRGNLNVTPWVDWFIGAYCRAATDTLRSIDDLTRANRFWHAHRDIAFNARQRAVLERYLAGSFDWLNSTKYAATAKTSTDTAQRDLTDLVAKRIIVLNDGKARKTSYRLADDFGGRSG